MKANDSEYVSKLKEIWSPLSKHMKEEEERDLPALESALITHAGPGESKLMSTSFS
jgi:hypothetical protein